MRLQYYIYLFALTAGNSHPYPTPTYSTLAHPSSHPVFQFFTDLPHPPVHQPPHLATQMCHPVNPTGPV